MRRTRHAAARRRGQPKRSMQPGRRCDVDFAWWERAALLWSDRRQRMLGALAKDVKETRRTPYRPYLHIPRRSNATQWREVQQASSGAPQTRRDLRAF